MGHVYAFSNSVRAKSHRIFSQAVEYWSFPPTEVVPNAGLQSRHFRKLSGAKAQNSLENLSTYLARKIEKKSDVCLFVFSNKKGDISVKNTKSL